MTHYKTHQNADIIRMALLSVQKMVILTKYAKNILTDHYI